MREHTPITVDVHICDDTDIRIREHFNEPNPFLIVAVADANLFLSSVSQAIELRDAAQHAVDAFVLAGEPVPA